MKTRKLSPGFVEGQLDKIDALYAKAKAEIRPSPSPDEFKQIRLSYTEFRAIMKNRGDLRYVDGFWAGWALAKGDQS